MANKNKAQKSSKEKVNEEIHEPVAIATSPSR
jgi:hypothetical protein